MNKKANLEVQRKQNFIKTAAIVKQLDDIVEMHLDLIVGLPFDYWDDVKYSIEEVFKLYPPELQLGFLKFLKGTALRDKEEHGFVFEHEPPYQLIESKYLSKEELHDIVKLEHALEIYWNKKRTIVSLKYVTEHYSIFEFLLELGKFFGRKREYHKYTLSDVYEIILDFAEKNYPEDDILKQLICLDYYSYYKVKPKAFGSLETDKSKLSKILNNYNTDKSLGRYIGLDFNFDIMNYLIGNPIIRKDNTLILKYNGKDKAEIINQNLIEEQFN